MSEKICGSCHSKIKEHWKYCQECKSLLSAVGRHTPNTIEKLNEKSNVYPFDRIFSKIDELVDHINSQTESITILNLKELYSNPQTKE